MTTARRKIVAASIDYDGTYGKSQGNDEGNIVLNKALLQKIIKKSENSDASYIFDGSSRQDFEVDGWGIDDNSNGSCFPEFVELEKYLISLGIYAELCKLTLADVDNHKPLGHSFDRALRQDAKQIDHLKFARSDEYKLRILYAQMHYLAAMNPDAEIEYDFYDDRLDILDYLKDVFAKYPQLKPGNLKLNLIQNDPGERFPIIGQFDYSHEPIDYNWQDNVRLLNNEKYHCEVEKGVSYVNEDTIPDFLRDRYLNLLDLNPIISVENNNFVFKPEGDKAAEKKKLERARLMRKSFAHVTALKLYSEIDPTLIDPVNFFASYARAFNDYVENYPAVFNKYSEYKEAKTLQEKIKLEYAIQMRKANLPFADIVFKSIFKDMLVTSDLKKYEEIYLGFSNPSLEAKENAVPTPAYQSQYDELLAYLKDEPLRDVLASIGTLSPSSVNINQQNSDGRTVLWEAAGKGYLEVVKALLDPSLNRGIQIDLANQNGCTPLIWAAENGHLEVVKLLLSRGAKTDAKTNNDWTAFKIAVDKGHAEIVKLFLEEGYILDPLKDINDYKKAVFLLSHVKQHDSQFERDLIRIFTEITANIAKNPNADCLDLVKLLKSIKSDTSTKSKIAYIAGCMLIQINSNRISEISVLSLIEKIKDLLVQEEFFDASLAMLFHNIAMLDLFIEKNDSTTIISLLNIATQLLPDNDPRTELVLRYIIKNKLILDNNIYTIAREKNRIAIILNKEEKHVEIKRANDIDSLAWFNEVIKPLSEKNPEETAKFVIVLIRYVLSFTPPKTKDEINLINNLRYLLLKKHLELGEFRAVLSLLNEFDKIESNLFDKNVMPFVIKVIELASNNRSKLRNYYEILESTLAKFPEEFKKEYIQYNDAEQYLLSRAHENVKPCLELLFSSPKAIRQELLQDQIEEIIKDKTIKAILIGTMQLSPGICYIGAKEVDIADVLRKQIALLETLICPKDCKDVEKGSMDFFNAKFLPFVFECERLAKAVKRENIPVYKRDDSELMIAAVNAIITFTAECAGAKEVDLITFTRKTELAQDRDAVSARVAPVLSVTNTTKSTLPSLGTEIMPATSQKPGAFS